MIRCKKRGPDPTLYMKKKSLILCWIAAVLPVMTSAQSQEVLTLEQCRALALENNVKMKNAALAVEQSRQGKREALTKYFPSVRATGMWMAADKGLVEIDLLPELVPPVYLIDNGIAGAVTATQPLLAGGQIVNANKLAGVAFRVSGYRMEQTRDEVVLTTEKYYWQYVGLAEKLRTVATVERLLESTYKDVELYVHAGVTNRNDLMKVQLKRNEVKSTRLELENGLAIVKMLLGQYIGLGSDEFSLAQDSLGALPSPLGYKVDHRTALPSTVPYRLLDQQVEAARLQKRLAVGRNLPTVGVGASYSYDNFLNTDHRLGMIFASVSIPLTDWWGGAHAIKKQKIALQMAENEREDASELLLIRMQKDWNDLTQAYEQASLAQENIATAQENLRLNTDYYRAGTSTLTDLLDAQSALQQARDQYTDRYTDYMVKLTAYLQATGR